MDCKFCKSKCQKAGRQKDGIQKLYCKDCKKYQQVQYRYAAYNREMMQLLPALVCESVGVRSIGRLLKIGLTTVIRKIKTVAERISKPLIPTGRNSFELDELRT
jgi:transposase-like protein